MWAFVDVSVRSDGVYSRSIIIWMFSLTSSIKPTGKFPILLISLLLSIERIWSIIISLSCFRFADGTTRNPHEKQISEYDLCINLVQFVVHSFAAFTKSLCYGMLFFKSPQDSACLSLYSLNLHFCNFYLFYRSV